MIVPIPWPVYGLFLAPLSALALGFFIFRPYKPEWTHLPILASCAVVAACAAQLAGRVYSTGWGMDGLIYEWVVAGRWGLPFGVRIDGLSMSVLSMVSVVGGLIHVYAAGYMKGDPGFARFFLLFHLFFLAMIGLLISNNFVQLYLFWELVGAASYLLIGFWHHKASARRAALQAFMVNRVGDFGLLLAVVWMTAMFGNTRFAVLFQVLAAVPQPHLAAIGFLLFWAATAKSAQLPLYFWLPDAMEGPTPVSALMHAATMVTAGIFLLVRSWPLLSLVPGLPETIACVGAATAVMAGVVACMKTDLKRILAYSTVSHLGLMAFAVGLGQPAVAILHLIMHGFFKAVLFLCAGNIAHALGKPTALVDEVGGLRKKLPLTFACFAAAALSSAGIWPLAGFFSKDAIIDAAFHHGPAFGAVSLVIAGLSSFYIFRMLFLTFYGERAEQSPPAHPHEASPIMAVPIVFLSLGVLGAGWLSSGLVRMLLSGWPASLPAPALPAFSWSVAAAGTLMALVGGATAFALTVRRPSWDWQWRKESPSLEKILDADFGWKPLMAALASGVQRGAEAFGRGLDHGLWDGFIEGTATAAKRAGQAAAGLSSGNMADSLWWMMTGTAVLLAALVLR